MRKLLLATILVLILGLGQGATCAYAGHNSQGAWVLHYAGPHDPQANTCDMQVTDCMYEVEGSAPPVTGEDGLRALRLALMLRESAETGQPVVACVLEGGISSSKPPAGATIGLSCAGSTTGAMPRLRRQR